MKKKISIIVLILIVVINATIPCKSYAQDSSSSGTSSKSTGTFQDAQKHQNERKEEAVTDVTEEGKAQVSPDSGTREEKVGESKSSSNLIAGILGGLFALLPKTISGLFDIAINNTQSNELDSDGNPKYPKLSITNRFTIEDLVMGKYYLFNIDFMNFKVNSNNAVDKIKQNVSKWYVSIRNIAIVGNLILLIYIGIRIAISTVAEKQAKYKKMFYYWLTSFLLVFFMHYIFILIFNIQEMLVNFISNFIKGEGFEEQVINNTFNTFASAKGWNCVVYVIEMYALVYYQIKFFLVYSKRFFTVGFLFTISPLITLADAIYSVNSRVPIFKKWLREILYNIFLQVIHLAVYTVFILSAAEIAKEVPILGVLLLMTLSRTEKIVKTTFGLNGKGLSDEKLLEKIKSRGAKMP